MSSKIRQKVSKTKAALEKDPIFRLLSRNSSLATAQLESLLIDAVASSEGLKLSSREKARLRRKRVSKGAFNRTLTQAHRNARRALFTTLLLGYLGFLDTPRLAPFMELGERLADTSATYRDSSDPRQLYEESKRAVLQLIDEIAQPTGNEPVN